MTYVDNDGQTVSITFNELLPQMTVRSFIRPTPTPEILDDENPQTPPVEGAGVGGATPISDENGNTVYVDDDGVIIDPTTGGERLVDPIDGESLDGEHVPDQDGPPTNPTLKDPDKVNPDDLKDEQDQKRQTDPQQCAA